MENQNKKITPSQYFDYIKNAKNEITVESLKESFSVFVKLAEKYKKLGQKESLKKLCFLANVLQNDILHSACSSNQLTACYRMLT